MSTPACLPSAHWWAMDAFFLKLVLWIWQSAHSVLYDVIQFDQVACQAYVISRHACQADVALCADLE